VGRFLSLFLPTNQTAKDNQTMAIHNDIAITIDWDTNPSPVSIRLMALKAMRLNDVNWSLMKQMCAFLDEAKSIDETLDITRTYITVN
jgi:hypothetical protein